METTFGGTGGNEGESRKPGCEVVLGVGRSLPEGPAASSPASRTTDDRISAGGTEITIGKREQLYRGEASSKDTLHIDIYAYNCVQARGVFGEEVHDCMCLLLHILFTYIIT